MIYVHPFPARMAPEIALSKIKNLSKGKRILDPMSGSGMVLSQASRHGIESIGYDLDPLARLVSKTCATRANERKAKEQLEKLLEKCSRLLARGKGITLEWIDNDDETKDFIDFWFYSKQRKQLRFLSYYLVANPFIRDPNVLNILRVAVSRLIVTKEPKASLARDTAHSRPHRTIEKNDFDIYDELPASLNHVLQALDSSSIEVDTKTYLGDARHMGRIANGSIDAIVTSPPYLNAIDYMRGHRLSLVWLGYNLSKLRKIRRDSIGSENATQGNTEDTFVKALVDLGLRDLDARNVRMLGHYYRDLTLQLSESHRVLKSGGTATYVIGNSTIRGNYVQNSEFLKLAGKQCGLFVTDETIRKIADNRRYLPVNVAGKNALASRMRTEHIIEFRK